jgi:hypothetical protein
MRWERPNRRDRYNQRSKEQSLPHCSALYFPLIPHCFSLFLGFAAFAMSSNSLHCIRAFGGIADRLYFPR